MTIVISGQLATLNEHDAANRNNKFGGAKLKKEMTELVQWQVKKHKPIKSAGIYNFTWLISSKHDPDNIAFAKKYILDGLVKAGTIPNDTQKYVLGFSDSFIKVDKGKEKVVINIEQYELE